MLTVAGHRNARPEYLRTQDRPLNRRLRAGQTPRLLTRADIRELDGRGPKLGSPRIAASHSAAVAREIVSA
jgi:hypothetical protein